MESKPCKYCGFVGPRISDEDCPAKLKNSAWDGQFSPTLPSARTIAEVEHDDYTNTGDKVAIIDQLKTAITMLAEIYLLTGSDPDGDEDWRLAAFAVDEVKRLRKDHDAYQEEADDYFQQMNALVEKNNLLEAKLEEFASLEIEIDELRASNYDMRSTINDMEDQIDRYQEEVGSLEHQISLQA